ncbi:MAG: transcription-repair coupling factor [Oscillospiraceae bacterium]|nr:transcription-repair coupling factor [Oscillospiraceae bacterium]
MLQNFMEIVPQFRQVCDAIGKSFSMPVFAAGLSGAERALLAAGIYKKLGKPVLIITPDEASATKLSEDIAQLCSADSVALYPIRDLRFRSAEGSSAEYEQKRLAVLGRLIDGNCKIAVSSVEAALQYTIPPGTFKYNTFSIKRGESYDVEELSKRLSRAGYERRSQVDGPCQFSVRGGILDFYSPDAQSPVRIEFWGDEADSVAYFDLESQRRTREIEEAFVSPAREVLPDSKEMLIKLLKDAHAKQKGKHGVLVKENIEKDLERLDSGLWISAPDRYIPLIYKFPATLFDYLFDGVIISSEFIKQKEVLRTLQTQQNEDISQLFEEGILFSGCEEFSLDFAGYCSVLEEGNTVLMDSFLRSVNDLHIRTLADFGAMSLSHWGGDLETLLEDLRDYALRKYSVAVLCGTERAAHALTTDLLNNNINAAFAKDAKFSPGTVFVMEGNLSTGFEFPLAKVAVITQGRNNVSEKKRRKFKKSENPLKSLSDIAPGDYVVHVTNGIGIFQGIVKQDIRGVVKDYIAIRYAGTDMLYVPVTQLDLVSKYVGPKDDKSVKLNKLNSAEWQKTRSRVKAAVKDMAKELIALYSKRMRTEGYAFGEDTDWQRDFEERFPYEETDDQLRCIEEIKHDMETARPMDRLLCGDVGFGKTEVALRAAFKAVMDGKQVAVLVPTTILAWQHYQTFLQRMDGFPITVELLSRFRTPKQQEKILTRLRSGEIDIIIGTHRILQKDVLFKDLGLCVIDEEQRFGVAHKEKMKEMKASVDVLTLSATPIPRTLNMAMSGIRDMSTIEEAPTDRHPVQTYVMEYDRGVILEAIKKELRRGGQVFYLHNNTESISSCAARLQQDLPDAKIAYAHGKMTEETLSDIWKSLIDHETDILVCTTIIETGVDVPSCNTLIIENADHLGLSQLYQLRGRVGRSNRHAFAYFTFTRGKSISDVAQKRLSAIRDFTQFGSGFKIALRDLEIRGAGNILGANQHGHMESVGYEMYVRLLTEAIAEEKGEAPPPSAEDCAVDIALDAHIPEKYIGSLNQRVDMYKRIAAIRNQEDAADVIDELIDRFGEPPVSVMGLIEVATLRNMASAIGITDIRQVDSVMRFYPKELDLERISMATQKMQGRLTMNLASEKPHLSITLKTAERPIELMKKVLLAMRYDNEK